MITITITIMLPFTCLSRVTVQPPKPPPVIRLPKTPGTFNHGDGDGDGDGDDDDGDHDDGDGDVSNTFITSSTGSLD